jgi:ribosome biogenesis GTPase
MWTLDELGWTAERAADFERHAGRGLCPGRVAVVHRDACGVYTPLGELWAEIAGRLRHEAASRAMLPVTGDWVAVAPRPSEGRATVHAVLPRRSLFSRKAAGSPTEEQAVAANADIVFLVCGLDRDFNPRRIERALLLAAESGAAPVVVLTKADLCPDPAARLGELAALAPAAAVHAVSSLTGEGLSALAPYARPGRTVALVGSSGVGKSTLANRLLRREAQATAEVRAHDGRGRHTTTRRELIPLAGGGWIIDTPGLRELQLWADEQALPAAFADVEALAQACRFRDCRHDREPGCAVRDGLEGGRIPPERFASYVKLRRELRHLALRQDVFARQAEQRRTRSVHKMARRRPRE